MWYFGWLFIILMIIFVGLFVYAIHSDSYSSDNLAHNTGILAFITFASWIGMTIFAVHGEIRIMSKYYDSSIVSDTTIIKSIALNNEIDGTFFLGIGTIDQEDVYKYYQVDDSVTFKLENVPVNNTRVREVDADSAFVPHIVSYYYTKGELHHWWFFRWMTNTDEVEYFDNLHKLKEHIIYVPKGTIVGDVSKLNLK